MRRSAEFTTTVRRGRRASSRAVTVHVLAAPHATESDARVGFVVARSVGSAVERNRVRRRLRHLVRARLDTLPAGASVVIRAQPGAARLTSAELGEQLDTAFARGLV